MMVWRIIYQHVEEGLDLKVVWVTTHTTKKETESVSQESREIAGANNKDDELGKGVVLEDGWCCSRTTFRSKSVTKHNSGFG